ncbi:MAG: acetylornithine transaminase [Deltaproteobacteria bacterium]|nr:acetylornithine transaminase [Deltaproteobacteria bacterium]
MSTLASTADILARGRKRLLHCINPQPVVLDHGDGALVWDVDGNRYIDLLGGLAVTGLGHAHPRVVEAIEKQARKLIHASNLYATTPAIELAEKLCANSFAERVFFANSGAEANEAALKAARKYFHDRGEGRFEFVTAHNSFHGRTFATVTATGQEKYRAGFEPLVPGFRYVPFNDIEALARHVGPRTAAVLLEPIQGEGGLIVPSPGYLKQVRQLTREVGCLLILDEIQSGIGRTGTLFAYQQEDMVPDIITIAKGLGNGVPIGAMLTTEDISKALQPGTHASTFGGNPVACAAGNAVMDVLLEPSFLPGVRDRAGLLRRHLEDLAKKHAAFMGEVRGRGMWLGVELKWDGAKLVNYAREHGVLVNIIHGHVMRLAPPLVVGEDLMKEAFEKLDKAVAAFIEKEKPAGK